MLGELYQSVTAKENATFWWGGDEENWSNVLRIRKRDLNEPIPEVKLQEEYLFSYWKMETAGEERDYLEVEVEIWPDTIVGELMAWQEEDHGVIEDVFVREPWRKRGIAKYLLVQALRYLKANQLQNANLMVLTTNKSALSLYESVGFCADKEEMRLGKKREVFSAVPLFLIPPILHPNFIVLPH